MIFEYVLVFQISYSSVTQLLSFHVRACVRAFILSRFKSFISLISYHFVSTNFGKIHHFQNRQFM
jgi:hypothetical protein